MSATVTAIRQHPDVEGARSDALQREREYLLDVMREADDLVRLEFAEAVGKAIAHGHSAESAALVKAWIQHGDAKTAIERITAKSIIAAKTIALLDAVFAEYTSHEALGGAA